MDRPAEAWGPGRAGLKEDRGWRRRVGGDGRRVARPVPTPSPSRLAPLGPRGRGHSSHSSPRPSPRFNQTWAREVPPLDVAHWPMPPPAVVSLAAACARFPGRHFRYQVCGPGRPWPWGLGCGREGRKCEGRAGTRGFGLAALDSLPTPNPLG